MVRGNKLLYGHVPDHFLQCRIGSGHVRLHPVGVLTLLILPQCFGNHATGNEIHTTYLPKAALSFLSGSVESLKAAREYECTLTS